MPDLTLATHQMLELSNAHIPEATALAIENGTLNDELCFFSIADSGWLFPIDQAPLPLVALRQQGHGEFASLLMLAGKNGCAYLKLDADAFVLPGLPVFEW